MNDYQETPSPAQQYRRLLDTYGIPQDRRAGWLVEMADAFGAYPLAVLTRATDEYIRKVRVPADQYHEVPTPGTFAEWVYGAMEAAEREEQRALPPPAKPRDGWDAKSGPERVAFFERHVAIGKLRARAGKTDLNVPFEATEAQIAGVIGEMRARRFLHGTLERIAARDGAPLTDIGAQLTSHPSEAEAPQWPGLRVIDGGKGAE
jgi:hypothetical protein